MKIILTSLFFYFITTGHVVYSQQTSVDRVKFFNDTTTINATLTSDFKKIIQQKRKVGNKYFGTFSCRLNDSIEIKNPIEIEVRGHSRREICYMPPLKLNFDFQKNTYLYPLHSLKLVSACRPAETFDQYLLKEFMVYRIYNILCDKSFHVRLLNLQYVDSSGKKNTITEHAFLIEGEKEMAKRNDCVEWEKPDVPTELTDRNQMTMVAIFEYMIGNTDWSVTVEHNIRLIQSKTDSNSRPFAVPYDFDYSGLVNTDYSVPDENLGTQTVLERVYRGFPRTEDEINATLDIFKQKKDAIYAAVNGFNLLTSKSKREMTGYLEGFYDQIKNPSWVKSIFINGARTR
ncbi:MAG: hypothetical protein JST21_16700 [Bacteroidetes bacterium]|nr:hypothetical protein [Bacteroidota bacterium]